LYTLWSRSVRSRQWIIAMGAARRWDEPQGRWTVLADPQGNLFCAVHPEHRGSPRA